MTQLLDLSANEVSRAYARRELSPVELTRACLNRIRAAEPALNAMYLVHPESALASAAKSESRWRAGASLSPLDGVPITLKENIETEGDRAPIGTLANENVMPSRRDAPPAARVREAGCVLLGKTTMPDYGMLSSGMSSIHGVTRNPWRLDRNTSGSSSGAGAAAAAGYAPLHLGTDIGGSVRLPATHCGIFALKPSLGRVPIYPPYIGRVTGPMTRSVAASAALMNVLSKPDPRDFMSLPPDQTNYTGVLESPDADSVRGLRIGYLPDMRAGLPVHPEVRAAAQAAASALEGAGAMIEEIPSFLTEAMLNGIARFFEVRLHNDVAALSPERRARILPFVTEWCMWRADESRGTEVMNAFTEIMLMRDAAVSACANYDYLISPTSPILPYEAEAACPGNDPHDALPHIAFTVAYNLSEQPAASLNWTYSADGLPIGVQVIGKRFDDAGVLRVSAALEALRPAQRDWPQVGSSGA